MVLLLMALSSCEPAYTPSQHKQPSKENHDSEVKESVHNDNQTSEVETPSHTEIRGTKAKVIEIVDGDTLKVRYIDGPTLPSKTIRLIGVDTPEVYGQVEFFGLQASNYTKKQLSNSMIWLTKDVSETDQYGRALRYVWLKQPPADPGPEFVKKYMFNARLVAGGYAHAVSYPPDVKYQEVFRELQQKARRSNSGLWRVEGAKEGSLRINIKRPQNRSQARMRDRMIPTVRTEIAVILALIKRPKRSLKRREDRRMIRIGWMVMGTVWRVRGWSNCFARGNRFDSRQIE